MPVPKFSPSVEKSPVLEQVALDVVAPQGEKLFEVLEDFEVPRGASAFILRKGKVISSRGYDVEGLKNIGVQLQEK